MTKYNWEEWQNLSWEEQMEELRNALVRAEAQKLEEYKPTMIERIICYIKFRKLKQLI